MQKQKYLVTYAGVPESKQSFRSGDSYSLQKVCLRDISDPDEKYPDTWTATAFNKPTMKQGDTIEARITSDVKSFNGKFYNDIELADVTIIVNRPEDDQPK